ncbi:hypothetical protein OPQ81_000472 [Rhizoctonia solani]|nr:hypothetical protein OPQ81_000472 [Rhizoctonia solani]
MGAVLVTWVSTSGEEDSGILGNYCFVLLSTTYDTQRPDANELPVFNFNFDFRLSLLFDQIDYRPSILSIFICLGLWFPASSLRIFFLTPLTDTTGCPSFITSRLYSTVLYAATSNEARIFNPHQVYHKTQTQLHPTVTT